MIKCLVCKEYKSEGNFIELKYGGLAICWECWEERKEEAEKLKEEARKKGEEVYIKRMEHNKRRKEAIKNQSYEGQYDWMGEY